MKAKEDKIREAYGNYNFGQDKDGWVLFDELPDETDLGLFDFKNGTDNDTGIGFILARPKSLQGIENNNSWIKIESEDDLPKDGHYWVFTKSGEIIDSLKHTNDEFMLNDDKYWLENFTHYQPIQKPNTPLY